MVTLNKKKIKTFFYHAFLISFGFIMIYPVLWMITGSLRNNAEILSGNMSLIPENWRWENFANGWRGFGGVGFGTFFKNSFVITTVSTIGTVVSSACVAYAFSRIRFFGRNVLFVAMLLTMMLPGQVILIPQYIIYNQLGLSLIHI